MRASKLLLLVTAAAAPFAEAQRRTTTRRTAKSTSTARPSTPTVLAPSTTLRTSTTSTAKISTSTAKTSTSMVKVSSTSTSKTSTSSLITFTSKTSSTSTSSTLTSTSKTSTSTSSASATPTINSGKRGLTYNDPALTQPYSLAGQNSKVSWAYNWASTPYFPNSSTSGTSFNPALRFIPMLWSDDAYLTSIWTDNVRYAKASLRADALLGFNEPDNCGGQACMNVSHAVAVWKQYIQPFAGQLALGAPAVTNAAGSGVGLDWLAQFLQACTGCTVDFLPVHYYGSVYDPAQLTAHVQQAQQFGKPVWVTEYGTTSGTPAEVLTWLKAVVPWLDANVVRHAYFFDNPGDTWLINANGSGLNDLGKYYNNGN